MSTEQKTPRSPAKIVVGYRVGWLRVEAETEVRKNRYTVWRCRCDCGGEILLDTRYLQRGTVTDCGCRGRLKPGTRDLRGRRFGHLTALQPTEQRNSNGCMMWLCRCELCGEEKLLSSRDLLTGNTKSCGNHSKRAVEIGLHDGSSIRKLEYYRTMEFPLTKSGYTGVSQRSDSGKWTATMKFQGKIILRETFDTKDEAIRARKKAESGIGEFLERFYEEHPDWDRDYYTRDNRAVGDED